MSKYGYLRAALAARGLLNDSNLVAPVPATLSQVAAAHDRAYAARALAMELSDAEQRRLGLPRTAAVARRAALAASGTLLAARLALGEGVAINAAGGSHHAGPDFASGYCLLNDVAIAAANLLEEGAAGRVLVVDADVHQGDGTARIFEEVPGVFTFSIHAAKNFPARKAVSDLDIALPDGTEDASYLNMLSTGLDAVLERVTPDLVFYNSGVDIWEGDRLGRLGVTLGGIRARERMVLDRFAGTPLVGVMGGGYSDDPEELAARHAILFEEAARG